LKDQSLFPQRKNPLSFAIDVQKTCIAFYYPLAMNPKEAIAQQISTLRKTLDPSELTLGEIIFNNSACQVLSQSSVKFELMLDAEHGRGLNEYVLHRIDDELFPSQNGQRLAWDCNSFACLLQIENELRSLGPKQEVEHKKYTREGMVKRVLDERRQKAEKARYRIKWASNIYGDHILINEHGVRYRVFLRDFTNQTGYSDSMDSRINKLGTTKHIMFAFKKLKEDPALFNSLSKTFPFIEIFCDPLNEYKITWFYPAPIPPEEQLLVSRYFKNSTYIEERDLRSFLGFISEAGRYPHIRIRPEVQEKLELAFEEEMLDQLRQSSSYDYSSIHGELFPYQKEGIDFALFRKSSIIADEMGLSKTV